MKDIQSIITRIAILLTVILFIGCGNGNGSKAKNGEDTDASIPVEVTTAEIGDVSAFFSGTTTLEAEEDALVIAKVNGIVKEIYVEEGDYVKTGDLLAKLDDDIYRIQLSQSEATMNRLKAEYDRMVALISSNAASMQEFQRSKFDYMSQKAAYELAKLNLDYTSIRAPISGIITERMIKIGNMVLTNAETFHITDFDPLLAVLYVPERELDKLKEKQQTTLSIDAIKNQNFVGYIDRISPVVNPETGTVKVTVKVSDPTGKLKVGMFARANIIYDVHKNTLLVPKDAILKEDTETAIFVVQDSVAFRRIIKTGYTNSTHVEALEGVTKNDLIVLTGQGSLKDSSVVEVINPGL